MPLIAITGGIGAGKSTVLTRFRELGCETMDADDAVHALYQRDSVLCKAMYQRWGADFFTEEHLPHRKKIADLVFHSKTELEWLNALVHPLVRELISARATQCPNGLFCAIPLFYECGFDKDAAYTIALWCNPAVQHQRLLKRGWSEDQIQARIAQQLSMDEKLLRSDFAILSTCSWENLYRQCDLIFAEIQQKLKCQ